MLDGIFYISADNMSQSTSKHINYAHQAAGYNNPNIFRTPAFSWSGSNPRHTHETLIKPAADRATEHLETVLTSNRRQATKTAAIHSYIQERERILQHAARFNVQITMIEIDATPEALAEYTARKEAARKEAARQAAETIRQAAIKKQQREDKKQLVAWLTTGAGRYPASFRQHGADQFTIRGNQIVTSQGAECPLDHAIKALRFYDSRRTGKTWTPYHTNGHKIPLGIFTLNSIDEAGNVKAGCHTFTTAEIARFKKQWYTILQEVQP